MYELLLKAGDNTSPDPEKDKACYKDRDIIQIEKEGYRWTPEERKRVVRADISDAEAMKYVEVEFEEEEKAGIPLKIKYRRLYFVKRPPSQNAIITINNNDIIRKA